MMSKITYKVKREEGFVFTATAMVISVILGLTILFMTNTIRTESVRVAELHSSQDAYWQAVADVEMAANMIQLNGTSILGHLNTYFPNITITSIDQNNMVITSQVTTGNVRAGAKRAASINITSPNYSIIEKAHDFEITGFADVDGGNLYIGDDVELKSFWFFSLAHVGHDSLVNFFIPTGKTLDPNPAVGSNNYTVTNVPKIGMPGFDDSAYKPLIDYAHHISFDNPAIGEWKGNTTIDALTHPGGLDLQNVSYTGGGMLSGLGNGIFVEKDLEIDGTAGTGTFIVDNNTAANPGFIIVAGKLKVKGDWFLWLPTFLIPDNVIIIAKGDIEFTYTNFGESTTYPPSTWSNYVNEIYTKKNFEMKQWTNGTQMFGQFHVLGHVKDSGWMSSTSGILYAPKTIYDFGSLFSAFPNFDGTFYVKEAKSDQFSWAADINLDSRARLGRGLPGGIVQPATIPWVVLGGTLREI